jgi:hypothetical protein
MTPPDARAMAHIIVAADVVARERGDEYGLCDCIDNAGRPYPSQWGSDLIKAAYASLGLDPAEHREAEAVRAGRNFLVRVVPR